MVSSIPASLLSITGPDAETFLQRLTINDLRPLGPGERQLSGLCTAKGRLIALFWLERTPEVTTFSLIVDLESAEYLQQMFQKYRLRQRVEIERGEEASPLDPQALIVTGTPWILPPNREMLLPQWVNLDLIGALSFTKGCYPGQEVVARTHYQSTHKRRMIRVAGLGTPPNAGTPCYGPPYGDQIAGWVILSAPTATGYEALITVLPSLLESDSITIGTPHASPVARLPLPYTLDR
ncbi:MAG: hypothetical protein N2557_01120 [Hydrogenophilus sp.]|nr:hypothetical protein [Hydrogenophilus sp.]